MLTLCWTFSHICFHCSLGALGSTIFLRVRGSLTQEDDQAIEARVKRLECIIYIYIILYIYIYTHGLSCVTLYIHSFNHNYVYIFV